MTLQKYLLGNLYSSDRWDIGLTIDQHLDAVVGMYWWCLVIVQRMLQRQNPSEEKHPENGCKVPVEWVEAQVPGSTVRAQDKHLGLEWAKQFPCPVPFSSASLSQRLIQPSGICLPGVIGKFLGSPVSHRFRFSV